ncbi:hypothetical protein AAVH_35728, partial [Aphelenchoides avenae]
SRHSHSVFFTTAKASPAASPEAFAYASDSYTGLHHSPYPQGSVSSLPVSPCSSDAASTYSPPSSSSTASAKAHRHSPSSAAPQIKCSYPPSLGSAASPSSYSDRSSASPPSSSSAANWYELVDGLLDEVRSEIRAESFFTEVQQTTRPSRKRSAAHQVASSSFRAAKPEVPSPASSSSLGAERFASPPAAYSSSSCSSSSSPPPPKRGKKYSLQGLSAEEIAERKKEQNRIAAQRYRTRKTQTLEEGRSEIAYLEERNAELRLEEQEIAAEIRRLKEILVGGV